MATQTTYQPDEAETSFDVALIEAISTQTGRMPTALPAIGDEIDLDAVTALCHAQTRTSLDFDVTIPGAGMGVDGDPATTVTVSVETQLDAPVRIVVSDDPREPGGTGAAPRIW